MRVDTFGAYVRAELEHWGREFALHRDCENLGYQSKNLLAVLMENKGETPHRVSGRPGIELDPRAERTEAFVLLIGRHNLLRASVLRGFYCGLGRRSYERLETAQQLYRRASGQLDFRLARQRFFAEEEIGRAEYRGYLNGLSSVA